MFKFCMKLGVSWISSLCLIYHEGAGGKAVELLSGSPWSVSIACIFWGSGNPEVKFFQVKGRHDTERISTSRW